MLARLHQFLNAHGRPLILSGILSGTLAVMLSACGGEDAQQQLDPVVVDSPIAYVKRPIALDEEGNPATVSILDLTATHAGADLFLRERATPSGAERNLTAAITGGGGDVRDVSVSFDGTKLVFALRLPLIDEDDLEEGEEQPTWNIWEYDVANDVLRRVIESNLIAESGHDISPRYLPDGRIVFSSTRQRRAKEILLTEGKPQFDALDEDLDAAAFNLHVMPAEGTEIKQITFNPSHDLDPATLDDGTIVFSRWDNVNNVSDVHLYSTNPDGSALHPLFGLHRHDAGIDGAVVQFVNSQPMPDGRLLVGLRDFEGPFGDALVLIDTDNFADIEQPLVNGGGGQALALPTAHDIPTDGSLSADGRLSTVYPLTDGSNRLLLGWSPCRLMVNGTIRLCTDALLADESLEEAPPLYGLYIYDMDSDTQLPIVVGREGVIVTDAVALQPRVGDIFFDGETLDPRSAVLQDEQTGVLHIRSVYDFDGTFNAMGAAAPLDTLAALMDPAQAAPDDRPARFLRIVKSVAIPDDEVHDFDRNGNGSAFGINRNQLMREIVGYAPIEPDGSVMVKVPANVSLGVTVVDRDGERLSARHQGWFSVAAGEMLECNGCHNHTSGVPHGRPGGAIPVHSGAPTSSLPFPNTDPTLTAEIGETMAQTRIRHACGGDWVENSCSELSPTVDITFEDLWPDTSVVAAADPFAYRYSDLTTPIPTVARCVDQWTADCRIVINYEDHIAPLWDANRQILDVDDITVLEDHTCTTCHTPRDAMGELRIPDAQLNLLTESPDDPAQRDFYKSYEELLLADNELEIVDGLLIDRVELVFDELGNPVFLTDDEGNFVDEAGNLLEEGEPPIQATQTFRAPGPFMNTGGASDSSFFQLFTVGGSHQGRLSDAELRLLREWLDVGGQYFNNPFDAPEQD